MKRIDGRFEAFFTQDQRIPHQNVIVGRRFSVIVLATKAGDGASFSR